MSDLSTAWPSSIGNDRVLQLISGERPSTLAAIYTLATAPSPRGRRRGRKFKPCRDHVWADIAVTADLDGLGENQNDIVRQLEAKFDYKRTALKEMVSLVFNHPRKKGPC